MISPFRGDRVKTGEKLRETASPARAAQPRKGVGTGHSQMLSLALTHCANLKAGKEERREKGQ